METVRDVYKDAIEYEEDLLRDVIEIFVYEWKILKMDDPKEKLVRYLNPSEEKREKVNALLRKKLKEMRERRRTA